MELQNVNIAGVGVISGGNYNKVSIAGSANSNGEINCVNLKVAGSATFNYTVISDEINSSGSIKFMQDVKAKLIKSAGAIKINGNVSSETFKVDGSIEVKGECNIGTLNHKVESSKYNNIYGESIKIINRKRRSKITVNEIEATTIELKAVSCKRVSGDNLIIKSGCEIDIIEFRNSLIISKKANVKEIIKL